MKILFIIQRIAPLYSGAGIRISRLSQYLEDEGHSIFFMTSTENPHPIGDAKIETLLDGKFPEILKEKSKFYIYTKLFYESFRKIKNINPDFIFFVGFSTPIFLQVFSGIRQNIPVLGEMTLNGADDAQTLVSSRYGYLKKLFLKKLSGLVVISPILYHKCVQIGLEESKLSLIGNDIDTNRFKPCSLDEKMRLRLKHNIPLDSIVFISMGSINPRKGMKELTEQFCCVFNSNINVFLLLVGPQYDHGGRKEYIDAIRNISKSNGFENKICLYGETQVPDELLQLSDIFVFFSRNEGFGNALAEAMSTGLPCAIRNIPGVTEYVTGNIPSVLIGDTDEEVGNHMHKLLKDTSFFTDTAVQERRSYIENNFSPKAVYGQYNDLFKKIHNGNATLNRVIE